MALPAVVLEEPARDKLLPQANLNTGNGHLTTAGNQGQRSWQQWIRKHKYRIIQVIVPIIIIIIGLAVFFYVTKPVICLPSCPDKWTVDNGTCYFASHEERDYNSSKNFCEEQGASLLLLNNETMEVMKHLRVDNTDLWIGLRKTQEGKWQWDNGTLWSGEMTKDNKDLNCASFNKEIHPLACLSLRHWICIKATEAKKK